MVGAAETIVSPSSSSTSRSTPCVLGCCGPILTVIVSVRISAIGLSGGIRASGFVSREVGAEFVLRHLQRLLRTRAQPNLHREILSQRMPFPFVGHQQPAQVAVLLEDDA